MILIAINAKITVFQDFGMDKVKNIPVITFNVIKEILCHFLQAFGIYTGIVWVT